MEFKLKTIHFQLPMNALPFLTFYRISILSGTCVRQSGRGVFNQFHSECKLNNLVFRKSETLKHQEIKQVLDTCKKYNNFGVNTLIVKGESDLTIWIEQTSQSSTAAKSTSDRSEEVSQTAPTAPEQSLPTKTVTKRYRGQVYEETVVDWAAVAMQNKSLPTEGKERRKYRGNYID